jgi:class 3 adenylate cyclase
MWCPNCGHQWPDDQRFCGSCGHALDAQAGLHEERKIITVLFCDLVGSTARADGSDPEDVEALMRPYHECVRTELGRYGAAVEKFIGDAVMAVFGAPVAHEDDGERAVRAGLRILEAIGELNAAHPGLGLEVRIGVATGEAIARLGARPERGEGLVVGDVVNTAARLQTAAAPGSVMVAEVTHRLTAEHFDWLALEPVTVKGKAAPCLSGVRSPPARALAPTAPRPPSHRRGGQPGFGPREQPRRPLDSLAVAGIWRCCGPPSTRRSASGRRSW